MHGSNAAAKAGVLQTGPPDRPLDHVACCADLPEPAAGPVAAPEFRSGRILDGRFLILEALSSGGMATIYRAEDRENHGQTVAVKVPHLNFESDPAFYRRFRREEEMGLKLDHPAVLKLIPTVGRKSRPYIVTEYLRGCTLDGLMHKGRPLREGDALRIASVICGALQHMHERGVNHNDLKPSNVMICSDRTLRVMDFGLASSPAEGRGLFGALAPIFGTPQYMAPEQVKGKRTDGRTDVYCLGAMLFEMLTGHLPFASDDPWASVHFRVSGDPAAPRSLRPALSLQAEEIVLHAMRRKPADRYPTAAAFQAELDAPDQVPLTGYCLRLKAPRWKLSLEGMQVLTGTLLGLGAIVFLVLMFFFLRQHVGRH